MRRPLRKPGSSCSARRNASNGAIGATGVHVRHAEVVEREHVRAVGCNRLLVALRRVGVASVLVQRDPALVPQLGRVRELLQQTVVQLHGGRRVLAQQVHLGHGLQDQRAILAAVERQAILAQRLGQVALLPEGKPEVVVGERPVFDHFHRVGEAPRLARLAHPLVRARVEAFERQVRVRPP